MTVAQLASQLFILAEQGHAEKEVYIEISNSYGSTVSPADRSELGWSIRDSKPTKAVYIR